MIRRTALKLAAATVVAPTLQTPITLTETPRTPDGDTWDNWAAGMSEWEVTALRREFAEHFGLGWQQAVRGGWMLEIGDYELSDSCSWWAVFDWGAGTSMFWIVHPTCYALEDLENAASWFRHVGVPVLGTGGTSCGRVACCFLNEPEEEVLGAARAWRLSQWDPDEPGRGDA